MPVEHHVPDARFAVGDTVTMRAAVSGAVAEDQVDLVRLDKPQRDAGREEAAEG